MRAAKYLFGCLLVCSISVSAQALRGKVKIDGSSTVFPITEAMAEEYGKLEPRVRIQVGVSGTGGGFKKFAKGTTDINNASRKIKQSEEEAARKTGVSFLDLAVAYDGISIVVNPKNTWASDITTAELKKIWEPGSKVELWSDIRPSWPKEKLELFGPGTDSGTFDYFTEAINGKSHVSRTNFTKSEDDNVLVKGVAGNLHAMGFFGFAYYEENKDKLKALKVDGVLPNIETIKTGAYKPLSREVFIYVSKTSLQREEVKSFVGYYLQQVGKIAKEVGYVPLPDSLYAEQTKRLAEFMSK